MDKDKLHNEFLNRYELSVSANPAFHEVVEQIFKAKHVNATTFMKLTSLDPMFYTRLTRANEQFSLRIIVTLCVGLGLGTGILERLLSLMSHSLSPRKRLDCLYRFVVEHSDEMSIQECNDFLKSEGVKSKDLLGSQTRE
ncbi:hypothetical protein [Solibaculum mannosilyticum]|uniref:hypothetical protein n=1 Tax=Solibaculum mannosilyticum TaxID=2780922 RepID=UPI0034B14304